MCTCILLVLDSYVRLIHARKSEFGRNTFLTFPDILSAEVVCYSFAKTRYLRPR